MDPFSMNWLLFRGGGGGGGVALTKKAFVQIATHTSGSNETSFSLASGLTGDTDVIYSIFAWVKAADTASNNSYVQLNADTNTAHYANDGWYATNGGAFNGLTAATASGLQLLGNMDTGTWGVARMTIFGKNVASSIMSVSDLYILANGGARYLEQFWSRWTTPAQITSITVFNAGTNGFATNSYFELYAMNIPT